MTHILTVNGGSSSIKLSVLAESPALYSSPIPPYWERKLPLRPDDSATQIVQELLHEIPETVHSVCHRVVHGGLDLTQSCRITAEVKQRISELCPLAPLHNPLALELIALFEGWGERPQYAAFDTAFFSTLSKVATTLPIPLNLRESGFRRYGFHGLNHSYCAHRIESLLGYRPEKLVICHLGNGASVTALRAGQPIETTMSYTPLDGLMMGTRCGSIDPGVVVELCRSLSPDTALKVLSKQSGILGVTGVTSDMREVLAGVEREESIFVLAYEMFQHSLLKCVGAAVALLDGIDFIVFSGGIGEGAAKVRTDLLQSFSTLPQEVFTEQSVKPNQQRGTVVIEAREDIEMVMSARRCSLA